MDYKLLPIQKKQSCSHLSQSYSLQYCMCHNLSFYGPKQLNFECQKSSLKCFSGPAQNSHQGTHIFFEDLLLTFLRWILQSSCSVWSFW